MGQATLITPTLYKQGRVASTATSLPLNYPADDAMWSLSLDEPKVRMKS